jgi:hypothetical protein
MKRGRDVTDAIKNINDTAAKSQRSSKGASCARGAVYRAKALNNPS